MTDDERSATTNSDSPPGTVDGSAHDSAVEGMRADPNRMLGRRSPVGESSSGLVSRDYQPRTGGPELIASWPLGPAPRQDEPGDMDWKITDDERVTLQKNTLTVPFVGPIDYAKIYLAVTGFARLDTPDGVLTVHLSNQNLSGSPYETAARVEGTDRRPFTSPMVEFTPETDEYDHEGRIYGGYRLEAEVSGGVGLIDQGTAVELWSE